MGGWVDKQVSEWVGVSEGSECNKQLGTLKGKMIGKVKLIKVEKKQEKQIK